MDLTFCYEVEYIKSKENIASVTFVEEVTDECYERLKKSYESGDYAYISSDAEIADIYDAVYDCAMEIEEEQGYYDLIGTELKLTGFYYPKEIRQA